jgi:hypothetical protein
MNIPSSELPFTVEEDFTDLPFQCEQLLANQDTEHSWVAINGANDADGNHEIYALAHYETAKLLVDALNYYIQSGKYIVN